MSGITDTTVRMEFMQVRFGLFAHNARRTHAIHAQSGLYCAAYNRGSALCFSQYIGQAHRRLFIFISLKYYL